MKSPNYELIKSASCTYDAKRTEIFFETREMFGDRSNSRHPRSSAEVQWRQRSTGKKAARIVNAVRENRSSSLSTVTNCNSGSRTRCRVAAMVRVINCNVAAVCSDDFFHELFACQDGLMEARRRAAVADASKCNTRERAWKRALGKQIVGASRC